MQDREALNLLVLVTADAVHTVFVLVISDTESPKTIQFDEFSIQKFTIDLAYRPCLDPA